MPRITPVSIDNASPAAREQLEGVQKKFGGVPNLLGTLGHSSAALGNYLVQSANLEGALNAQLREQIALAVAGYNGCGYCAAAHTVIGKGAGVAEDEAQRNLAGESDDDKVQAALTFARAVTEKRGRVSDDDFEAVRNAGFSDGEILEIIAVTTFNIYTNYINEAIGTEIDFPKVEIPAGAGA